MEVTSSALDKEPPPGLLIEPVPTMFLRDQPRRAVRLPAVSKKNQINTRCPDCNADLVIDVATGKVIFHNKAKQPIAGGKDFDTLLAGLDDDKNRAEELFEREKAAMKDRDRLLDEKFKEAMKRAADEPEDEPPLRPFDLD